MERTTSKWIAPWSRSKDVRREQPTNMALAHHRMVGRMRASTSMRTMRRVGRKCAKERTWIATRRTVDATQSQRGREMAVHVAPMYDLAVGLDAPIQAIYLGLLLAFLGGGSYLVVRQVLVRQELESAAKELGERVRNSQATAEEYFELGAVLLRKKLYSQAAKNLEKARDKWEGEPEELAQLHNALGYAYAQKENYDQAVQEYRAAVSLQPGYVTAWNNLGDALESKKDYKGALEAFEEALAYAPDNKVAKPKVDQLRTRVRRLRL